MKKVISFLMIMVLLSINAFAVNVKIDDEAVMFTDSSGYPFIENGRTLVPLRATMEKFGANVSWDDSEKTAIIKKDNVIVKCQLNKNYIIRNDVKIENDASAKIINSRIYLPIRVVLEAFSLNVDWLSAEGTVYAVSPSGKIINSIEKSGKTVSNIWAKWSNAMNLFNSGNYSAAINAYIELAPTFLGLNDLNNDAMLFNHLGECYSKTGNYEYAAACFKREAYYWNLLGKTQETISANRKATNISSTINVYAKTTDKNYSCKRYYGAVLEPHNGIMLGAYAEGDTAVHDAWGATKFYINDFPQLVGKDMSAYLLYLPYGKPLSTYQSHIEKAKAKEKIIQLALEPQCGLSGVNETDGYLINLAKDMESSGVRFMLRFAGEMNDVTNKYWYTKNYQDYINAFRKVSNVFKQYAPSVAIIWAPNFFPPDTIEKYYPGDEYVDYVGVSLYENYQPEVDPLNEGVDRSRWSSLLDTIYTMYADRKPIIIVEGSSAYYDEIKGLDLSAFASAQMYDFYTYLPIRYPDLKGVFLYDSNADGKRFVISENNALLDAYKRGIVNSCYLSDYSKESDNMIADYYEVENNVNVAPKVNEISAYLKHPVNNVSYVAYIINGKDVGVSYSIPYSANIDFSQYSGKIDLTVKAFDTSGNLMCTKQINCIVK